jgi:hypothetical protein
MRYSRHLPTEPGYYWLKAAGEEEIVEVWTDPILENGVYYYHSCGSGESCELTNLVDGLWAGPLEKPLLPSSGEGREPRSRFT